MITVVTRRRIRWFFAGLLVVTALLNVLGSLLVSHQSRSQLLESLVPVGVTLGSRTGVVMAAVALVFLASGIARGKRVAWQLACLVLGASIALEVLNDLDFEGAALPAWTLLGLWWFRDEFTADSNPASLRRGFAILGASVLLDMIYAIGGALLLRNQLSPGFGIERSVEHLARSMAGSQSQYVALTARADWFLSSVPWISYVLLLISLSQLLRPALAPYAAAIDRDRLRGLLELYGSSPVSHLALHGASSYYWPDTDGVIAFSLHGRTALVLGPPICAPARTKEHVAEFMAFCERQDWIAAFYQVDQRAPYRELGMTLVPIGREAIVSTESFSLAGARRHDLRYAVRRCERSGIWVSLESGPDAWDELETELTAVSGQWLRSRGGPELGYSLGRLSTLHDRAITVAVARSLGGRLEGFVSWLPVPASRGWALDLMRRRPDAPYGVMEALLARSIEHARHLGVGEVSLGLVPVAIDPRARQTVADRLMRAVFWSLGRFQRGRSLQHFKEKFDPRWVEQYLAIPSPLVLPEVLVALARAHLHRSITVRAGIDAPTLLTRPRVAAPPG